MNPALMYVFNIDYLFFQMSLGTNFVYYFSGAPRRGTNMTGNYDPKIFSSPTYGGSTTRDPKFSFYFYADNSHLAVLSMHIFNNENSEYQHIN